MRTCLNLVQITAVRVAQFVSAYPRCQLTYSGYHQWQRSVTQFCGGNGNGATGFQCVEFLQYRIDDRFDIRVGVTRGDMLRASPVERFDVDNETSFHHGAVVIQFQACKQLGFVIANQAHEAEEQELKQVLERRQERAREELGMIKDGETV